MTRTVDPLLEELRQTALRMASLAEAILAKALCAVWERDSGLTEEVQHDDLEIDRIDVALDEQVIRALALQAPVAADLRRILAIRTMVTDLERVGDLSRNIAKSAARLAERPPVALPPLLDELADQTTRVLRNALNAFTETDSAEAQRVIDADDEIDATEDRLIQAVIAEEVIFLAEARIVRHQEKLGAEPASK